MTPEEWMNKNYGTGRTLTNTNNNLPAVKYHPNGRKSKLTKYAREVMILEIAEMILKGTERSIIVDVLHKKYNYSLNTVNDLISEGNAKACTLFTPEEINLAKRQIKNVSEEIMFDQLGFGIARVKAAELLGKLMGLFKPEIAIQNITNNFDASKLSDEDLLTLKALSEKKQDEQ